MAIVEGVGAAVNVECEISDSQSRERLVAAVDARELSSSAGLESDARRLYDRWAEIVRNRLGVLRDFDASQKERDAASAP